MRSLFLSAVLAIATFGVMLATPSKADAQYWRWRGAYPAYNYNYSPYYYGGYSYYPSYSYYYTPGYSSYYYYTPGYTYYYTPSYYGGYYSRPWRWR
jgi:hypothetical protein